MAKRDTQIGVEFLPGGVAAAQVQIGGKSPGLMLRNEFVSATGQQAQVDVLKHWVRAIVMNSVAFMSRTRTSCSILPMSIRVLTCSDP